MQQPTPQPQQPAQQQPQQPHAPAPPATTLTTSKTSTAVSQKPVPDLSVIPADLSAHFRAVTTMQQAMSLNPPRLFQLQRLHNIDIKPVIETYIVGLDNFLGAKNGITPEQADYTANYIVETYGGLLSLADIKVIFDKFKTGQVQLFERLSPPQIIQAVDTYANDRMEAAAQQAVNEANTHRSNSYNRTRQPQSHEQRLDAIARNILKKN